VESYLFLVDLLEESEAMISLLVETKSNPMLGDIGLAKEAKHSSPNLNCGAARRPPPINHCNQLPRHLLSHQAGISNYFSYHQKGRISRQNGTGRFAFSVLSAAQYITVTSTEEEEEPHVPPTA
jgi:hypothetical protein